MIFGGGALVQQIWDVFYKDFMLDCIGLKQKSQEDTGQCKKLLVFII